jgi:hypothetical protein
MLAKGNTQVENSDLLDYLFGFGYVPVHIRISKTRNVGERYNLLIANSDPPDYIFELRYVPVHIRISKTRNAGER